MTKAFPLKDPIKFSQLYVTRCEHLDLRRATSPMMEEQPIMVDPAIFEHLQEKIDEDTTFRDVSSSPF